MDVVMLDLYEVSIWPWIIANGVVAIWALLAHLEAVSYTHLTLPTKA